MTAYDSHVVSWILDKRITLKVERCPVDLFPLTAGTSIAEWKINGAWIFFADEETQGRTYHLWVSVGYVVNAVTRCGLLFL